MSGMRARSGSARACCIAGKTNLDFIRHEATPKKMSFPRISTDECLVKPEAPFNSRRRVIQLFGKWLRTGSRLYQTYVC